MSAPAVAIADALVIALNAASYTAPHASITAVRRYLPRFELEDFEDLQVSVVPDGYAGELDSRRDVEEEYRIGIGVQKAVDPSTTSAIDALMLLVDEIAVECMRMSLVGGTVHAVGVENDPIYSAEHLEEMRVFTSVLTVTFQTRRTV